jgi:two-component system capsular synthesis sensor histidine kinase RcsC
MLGGQPAGATARGRSFLVVEDHDVSREIMRDQLIAVGGRVQIAANGQEAFEAFRRTPSDIVLTDIEMPEMDGYALTAAIRALGAMPRPIILAITASDFDMNEQVAHERGFDGYMLKPLELAVLEAKLASLVRQPESLRA